MYKFMITSIIKIKEQKRLPQTKAEIKSRSAYRDGIVTVSDKGNWDIN